MYVAVDRRTGVGNACSCQVNVVPKYRPVVFFLVYCISCYAGHPSEDINHPDYVPSVKLGYGTSNTVTNKVRSLGRLRRRNQRSLRISDKRQLEEVADALLQLSQGAAAANPEKG